VADSEIFVRNVAAAEMESVAVDVSETAAKNVSKDEIESDAVALSDTD